MHAAQTNTIQSLTDLPPGSAIHFSGIGGSAMNGMALLLASRGFRISGTDPVFDPAVVNRLRKARISVSTVQDGTAIPEDTALLVATAALPADHLEIRVANFRRIPVFKYARMLGVLMNSLRGVAVAGTHGKTTTSAMCVAALRHAGARPGYVIGGHIPGFEADRMTETSDIFVAEACEYDRSFLNLRPQVAVITNVESDHLDMYPDLEAIEAAFATFAANITPGGVLLYCGDDLLASRIAVSCKTTALSFGIDSDCTYRAVQLAATPEETCFDIQYHNRTIAGIRLRLPGAHNVQNALAAFAAGHQLGCDPLQLSDGISSFSGVSRRFEVLGECQGATVMDDYAHHPTEIRALLRGVQQRFPGRRIVAVFQPHQISRTRFLFREFATAFQGVDEVLISDIYVARDTTTPRDVTAADLAAEMCRCEVSARATGNLTATTQAAREILHPDTVLITIGAGNVVEIARTLISRGA